jgi:hypothetical protein
MQVHFDADVALGTGHVQLPIVELDLDQGGQQVHADGTLLDMNLDSDALRAARLTVDSSYRVDAAELGVEDVAVRLQNGNDARVVTLRVESGTVRDVEVRARAEPSA